jgi:hypothetical protein
MVDHKGQNIQHWSLKNFKTPVYILYIHISEWKWRSVVSIVNMPLTGQNISIFSAASRLAVGPTLPPLHTKVQKLSCKLISNKTYLFPFDASLTKSWSVSGTTFWTKTCSSSCSPKGPVTCFIMINSVKIQIQNHKDMVMKSPNTYKCWRVSYIVLYT